MAYTPFGPWNPNAPPGINKSFLDALEAFLQSINSAATDSHITADGNGNETVKSVSLTHGRITQFTVFTGTGPVTGAIHGCSTAPVAIFVNYFAASANFGSPPGSIPYAWNVGATTCNIVATNAYNWVAIAVVV